MRRDMWRDRTIHNRAGSCAQIHPAHSSDFAPSTEVQFQRSGSGHDLIPRAVS